jgi:hypothetical protein
MSQNKYIVMVDDNFHFMDEDERYKQGEYNSYGEAAFVCKKIVDEFLYHAVQKGEKAEKLYGCYTMFGEDPYIISPDGDQIPGTLQFGAWEWAEKRCDDYIKDNNKVPKPFKRPYRHQYDLDGFYDI